MVGRIAAKKNRGKLLNCNDLRKRAEESLDFRRKTGKLPLV